MKRVGTLLFIFCTILFPRVASASPLVITQVKAGSSAASRLVEVYNNTNSDVDVTNWCVYYSSASTSPYGPGSASASNKRFCFETSSVSDRLILPAYSAVIASSGVSGLTPDYAMSEGLGSGSSGHVFIVDDGALPIDVVGWGSSAAGPETSPVIVAQPYIFERKSTQTSGIYQDTNNNAQDFISSAIRESYSVGALIEQTDMCLNIDGYQLEVPINLVQDPEGDCSEEEAPQQSRVLHITEMLPNAVGVDDENEFIEIHNPHDEPVSLEGYTLFVGPSYEKSFTFPSNLEISAGQYLAFYNSDVESSKFSLLNSSSRAKLVAPDSTIVSETESYSDPQEGASWSHFDDGWKMTQKQTPNAENEYSAVESGETTSSLTPCPEGKYRNPLTNRCKSIASAASSLTPCAADQVRNPATNRCRKVTSSGSNLTPCQPGQERNPVTNRCRKVGADSKSLAPCQAGYERNPETNRCRKVVQSNSTLGAPAAINPVSLSSRLIAVLVIMAILYGVYEYRSDIGGFIDRLRDKRGNPRPPG